MAKHTFLWHDYETTGADPRRDRPCQFAAQRTTAELELLGEPIEIFCTSAPDVLPHPQAALITGITPQQLDRDGINEAAFAARVHEEMAMAGTCTVGYNSLRFDDEFTRNLLYRNFYEPYAREWENGNSRWDLIDLVRMTYALRPQGVEWPRREDGTPSFRLEDLARANHLEQERAHDALSDVHALIGLARLLRARQPRLFAFYFDLRRKQRAFELLDVAHRTPVLHVSSRFPASRGCLALVVPLAVHATQPNAVIVYDLDADPAPLLELDAEEIADRVFSARADLPEDVERIPLKLVHANRSPALAPLSALAGVDLARIGLDTQRCMAHLERLRDQPGLTTKLQQVFARGYGDATPDAELALYSGFLNDADKRLLREVRTTPPDQLPARAFAFRDTRLTELFWRYRARSWPQHLSLDEAARWRAFCRQRLENKTELTTLTFDDYFTLIATLREDPAHAAKGPLFDALQAYGLERRRALS
jgi:exodeoxyribonuclease-1